MQKISAYVGCGLTHAPEQYRQEIIQFKDMLREVSWIKVLDFWSTAGREDLSPEERACDIYHTDIHQCVGTASVIIADLTYPSTGLGWELGTSIEKHQIPAFMCAKEGALVSHLPIGASLHEINTNVTFTRYMESIVELIPFFLEELSLLHKIPEPQS
jgi:nucleoside 2-deoxyribosyltransferase